MKNLILNLAYMFASVASFAGSAVWAQDGVCKDKIEHVVAAQEAMPSKVDLLWVIDDSSSMSPYQKKMQKSVGPFFQALIASNIDFQTSIITTSPEAVEAGNEILRSTDSEKQKQDFSDSFNVGTRGNDKEQGTESVIEFLKKNPNFVRENSHLVVVFITDEDDSSKGTKKAWNKIQASLDESGTQFSAYLVSLESKSVNYRDVLGDTLAKHYNIGADFTGMLDNLHEGLKADGQKFTLTAGHLVQKVTSVSVTDESGAKIDASRMKIAHDEDSNEIIVKVLGEAKVSKMNIEYQYDCGAAARTERDTREEKEIKKLIAEILFVGSQSTFLYPSEANASINRIAEYMKAHPDLDVSLIGVTSGGVAPIGWLRMNVGGSNSRTLSRARAMAVRNALVGLGISSSRIDTKGTISGGRLRWYSYLVSGAVIGCYVINPFLGMIVDGVGAANLSKDRRVIVRFRRH